jgi:hypothetical protein
VRDGNIPNCPSDRIGDWHTSQAVRGTGGGKPMSQDGLDLVMVMLFCCAILVPFWRQILVFLLLAVIAVFCVGLYYIVATVYP